ncbi:MAG: MFS transporter [Gammaproteobacteria bacterium]|nr:MFS transporter [Gammaproteobacteria bacterium]
MNKTRRIVLLSCVGSSLEYYDFIIYGMMIPYITAVFFVDHQPAVAYLKTFSILAIGYLARPLGGYLFGMIADIYGRKKTFLVIMSVMAAATLIMGLLPSYKEAGLWAPLLLILARILQGLSFGAEIPSVSTLIKEHSASKPSGHYFGWIISSTSVGALLASLVVFLMGRTFSTEEITQGLWRLPFILGGILAVVAFILRNRIDETPDFLQHQHANNLHHSAKTILGSLLKTQPKSLIRGFCMTFFFSYLIIFTLYLPVYLKQYFGYATHTVFSRMSMGILLAGLSAPVFGYLFDHIDRIKAIKVITPLFLVFLYASLKMLEVHASYALEVFLLGYQLFIAAYSTNLLAILPTLFPMPVRSTGAGLCYNLAYSVASLIPLGLSAWVHPHNYQGIILGCAALVISITFLGTVYTEPKVYPQA